MFPRIPTDSHGFPMVFPHFARESPWQRGPNVATRTKETVAGIAGAVGPEERGQLLLTTWQGSDASNIHELLFMRFIDYHYHL